MPSEAGRHIFLYLCKPKEQNMASEPIIDRRRALKNSIKLYGRTFFTMAVGLYNSRVVLEVLGVDDFGIYSLVGSIVVMFSFFTSTMASSMSRFFSYELAEGNLQRMRETFGTAMLIVAIVATAILLLTEGLGPYLLERLNIPDGSRHDAAIVYQLSIVTVILTMVQTCYMSAIIAREHMGAYAYIDIATSTLKLAAIFILKFVGDNKLILYATLIMLLTLCVTTGAIVYCRHNFVECRTGFLFRKPLFKSMMSYSGWNLYKTMCDCMRQTGINVVVNLYFGVAVNAAVAIALNVSSNVAKFTVNIPMAFKPQIIKAYAIGAYEEMQAMIGNTLRFSLVMVSMLVVPLFLEMPYILTLWLGSCPDYASIFCRLLCISMFFDIALYVLEFGIVATGRIKRFCLIQGTLTVSVIGIGAAAFALGATPPAIYVAQIVLGAICTAIDLVILHRLVPQFRQAMVYRILVAVGFICVVTGAVCYTTHFTAMHSFLRLVVVGIIDVALTCVLAYGFILSPDNRRKILSKLHLTGK